MPKNTFYNLSERKKQLIIYAIENEFSQYGYDLANIQRIIKAAGIPRGSFYQYFENKEDAFFMLLKYYGNIQVEYVKEILDTKEDWKDISMFDLIELLVLRGVDLIIEHPQVREVGKFIFSSQTLNKKKLKDEVYSDIDKTFNEKKFFKKIITVGMDTGEFSSNSSSEETYQVFLLVNKIIDEACFDGIFGDIHNPKNKPIIIEKIMKIYRKFLQ